MKTTIHVDNEEGRVNALSTWHPVEGRWVKIEQVFHKDGTIDYFTDGEEIPRPKENPAMENKS